MATNSMRHLQKQWETKTQCYLSTNVIPSAPETQVICSKKRNTGD